MKVISLVDSRTLGASPAPVKGLVMVHDVSLEAQLTSVGIEPSQNLLEFLARHQFTGASGQVVVYTQEKETGPVDYIFAGAGGRTKADIHDIESVRRAMGVLVKRISALKVDRAALDVAAELDVELSATDLLQQMVIIAHMSLYSFDEFRTSKKKEADRSLELTFARSDSQQALSHAMIIADALSTTRHLADLPGNIATPTYVSLEAKSVAEQYGLGYTVFGADKAKELGMGGFLAVDAGSHQPGKFVVLDYNPAGATQTIALIGKGVTFDTGGISLKPSNYMSGMKYDMSGAAAVIGTLKALAQLKPNIRVVGVTPLVENMPGGGASRQDDIITHMSGVTSEIQNTDAEGRLILADALCYAERTYSPDLMIDIATLTGACPHGVGTFHAAVMTEDEGLQKELCAIGERVGDRLWPLPFGREFDKAIESDVADIQNSGKRAYYAGPIVGGCYLRASVEKTPWAHIDIAGVADKVPGVSYLGSGATGAMVRVMIELALRRAQV